MMRRTNMKRAAIRGNRRRVRAQKRQGVFDCVKKIAKNPIVKAIAKKGLEYALGAYRN